MAKDQGSIKWFNLTKGYGFITPDNGGNDVFVHIRDAERSGIESLAEGQRVEYEIENDRKSGKDKATKLAIL